MQIFKIAKPSFNKSLLLVSRFFISFYLIQLVTCNIAILDCYWSSYLYLSILHKLFRTNYIFEELLRWIYLKIQQIFIWRLITKDLNSKKQGLFLLFGKKSMVFLKRLRLRLLNIWFWLFQIKMSKVNVFICILIFILLIHLKFCVIC